LSYSVININHTYLHIDIEILVIFTGKHYTESKDVGAVVTSVFFFLHSAIKGFMNVNAGKIVALRSKH
jgi:hypothetical protein